MALTEKRLIAVGVGFLVAALGLSFVSTELSFIFLMGALLVYFRTSKGVPRLRVKQVINLDRGMMYKLQVPSQGVSYSIADPAVIAVTGVATEGSAAFLIVEAREAGESALAYGTPPVVYGFVVR